MKSKALFLFLALLWACDSPEGSHDSLAFGSNSAPVEEVALRGDDMVKSEAPESPEATQNELELGRKLIKRGNLEFETEDLQKTITSIKKHVQAVGGYVATENSYDEYSRTWNRLTVRLPTASFPVFVDSVSSDVKNFDQKEITSQDVTEEFMDLETRITSKKKVEQRYLEILSNAKSIEDILKVEAQAGKIRVEIERMEGRLNYLKNQTSLSTVNIACYQVIERELVAEYPANTFLKRLGDGLLNGLSILESIIVGLVNIWPLALLIPVGVVVYRRTRRKAKAVEA